MRKVWFISFLVLLIGCGIQGTAQEAAQAPTQTPVYIRQVVTSIVVQTRVVTATPKPATATPKATATQKISTASTSTAAPEATPPPVAGKWKVNTDTSSFDDSKTVVLRLDAENEIPGTVESYLPSLIVRCQEHVKEVYVVTGSQPDVESGNLDGATVRMRFDAEAAMTHNAGKSTDGEALFLEPSQQFINLLLGHQKFVFGFTPYSEAPVEINFDIRGLPEVIGPLNDACK